MKRNRKGFTKEDRRIERERERERERWTGWWRNRKIDRQTGGQTYG